MNERDIDLLRKIWAQTQGKAWEPRGGSRLPFFDRMIEDGFVKRVNGRCGFELLKDVMIEWTPAGKLAMEKLVEHE